MPIAPPITLRELAGRYSPAQRRTVDAALALFAMHGVGGTSLQMIADSLGITKAAVYHQFLTKEAIAIAAIEVNLVPIENAFEAAQGSESGIDAREQVLASVIEAVVENRQSVRTLQSDPVLFRLLGDHPPSIRMWTRIFRTLLGHDIDESGRIRASALSAILGSVAYPFVIDLDDDTVRDELMRISRHVIFDSD